MKRILFAFAATAGFTVVSANNIKTHAIVAQKINVPPASIFTIADIANVGDSTLMVNLNVRALKIFKKRIKE